MILAFDLATNTGVAFGPAGAKVPELRSYKLAPGATQGARFLEAFIMTRRLIKESGCQVIVVEKALAAGGGGAAARVELAMGIRACVLAAAYHEQIPVKEYAVTTIRKHFIGKGNTPRAEAKRATIKRCQMLGWDPQNDNEADAAALWDYASMMSGGWSSPVYGGMFETEST